MQKPFDKQISTNTHPGNDKQMAVHGGVRTWTVDLKKEK